MYDNSVQRYENPRTPRPLPQLAIRARGGITATGLGKKFGDLWALRNLDLHVAPGTVLGLLGHNGAGKTTAIRILTTLSQPTEGSATVAGLDVVKHAADVRGRIGVASQQSTVDGLMSGTAQPADHRPVAWHVEGCGSQARRRAARAARPHRLRHRAGQDLLGRHATPARCRRQPDGQSRRSCSSTSRRPASTRVSRGDLWQMLADLVREGTTIILTTQYLEEADRMADDIVVLDHGQTVAHGTPEELKSKIGDDRIDVKVAASSELRRGGQRAVRLRRRRPDVRQRTARRHRTDEDRRAR